MGGSSTDSWRKKLDGRTLWAVNSRMALSIQKQSVNVIIWESFSLYAIYIIYQLRPHHKHASSLKYRIPSRYLWNRHTRWVWLKFGKLHLKQHIWRMWRKFGALYYSSEHTGYDLSLNILFTAAALPSSYIIPIPEKKYTWQATQAGCPSLKHMILCRNYTIMCFIAPLSCFAWLHYSSSLTVQVQDRAGPFTFDILPLSFIKLCINHDDVE